MLRLFEGYDALPVSSSVDTIMTAMRWNTSQIRTIAKASTAFNFGTGIQLWNVNGTGGSGTKYLGGRYTTTFTKGLRLFVVAGLTLTFRDSQLAGNQDLFSFVFDTNGTITLSTKAGGTIARTPADTFQVGEWFFFETQDLIGASSSGKIECRVNTVPALSFPAITNSNGTPIGGLAVGADMLFVSSSDNANTWDDLYILDDTGAVNTTYLGNVRVVGQKTTGNSTPLNFAIGGSAPAATNWQSVLNSALNDTKYVYSPNAGDVDLYTLEAIVNAPLVHGVQVTQFSRMDDATQRVSRNVIKSGAGAQSTGIDHYLNQTYTAYPDIWEINPTTSVGFTGSEVNALLAGPKVTV